MKLKNKILLAAAGLLVVSGAAATTGTFAWFTAAQTATSKVSTIAAKSNSTALKLTTTLVNTDATISLAAGTNTDGVDHVWTATPATSGSAVLTDISGDGKTFYKPSAGQVLDENNSLVETSANLSGAAVVTTRVSPYLYQFKLVFESTNYLKDNGGNELAIFVDPTSHIFDAGDTKSTTISGAARASIVDADALTLNAETGVAGGNVLAYFAPNDTIVDADTYLSSKDCDLLTVKSLGTNKVLDKTYIGTTAYTDAGDVTAASSKGYIGTTSTGKFTAYVNIWLEGQDSDCTNSNSKNNSTFDIKLGFYGVSNFQ